jgi:hypothetical protein
VSDHELVYRRTPGPIARVLGAIGTSSLLRSLGDQELDEPRPKVVWNTVRSSELRHLAFDLVDSDRDDTEAAAVLARAAGRHTKELRQAAATIRSDRRVDEDRTSHRAERLLVAAATGRPVEPLTDDQRAWFDRIRGLVQLPPAEGFAELAGEEPELGRLEGEVLRMTIDPSWSEQDEDDRAEALAAVVEVGLGIVRERTSSALVRTRAARDTVQDHLREVAGLAVPERAPTDP